MKKIILILMILVSIVSFSKVIKEKVLIDTLGHKSLEVKNRNGEVELETWNGDDIELEYIIRIERNFGLFQIYPKMKPRLKKSDYDKVRVNILSNSKGIIIEPSIPDTRDDVEIDYFIKIPKEFTNAKITLSSGDVTVKNISADLNIKSSSGDIFIESANNVLIKTSSGDVSYNEIKGNVNITTSSGDIEGNLIEGNSSMKVSSGDIDIITVKGNATFSTSSGKVDVKEVGRNLKSSSSSGKLEVGAVMGNATVSSNSGKILIRSIEKKGQFSSTSGDILVQKLGALESVETTSGDITLHEIVNPYNEADISTTSGEVEINGRKR